jgi:hypothetical protein
MELEAHVLQDAASASESRAWGLPHLGKKKSKAGLQRTRPFAGGRMPPQKASFSPFARYRVGRWDFETALGAMGSLLRSGILSVIFNLLKRRFFKKKEQQK